MVGLGAVDRIDNHQLENEQIALYNTHHNQSHKTKGKYFVSKTFESHEAMSHNASNQMPDWNIIYETCGTNFCTNSLLKPLSR